MISRKLEKQKQVFNAEKDLNYLFNTNRASGLYSKMYSLLEYAMDRQLITVDKYEIGNKLEDYLMELVETRGIIGHLLERLKAYPSEDKYVAASIFYVLQLLDPHVEITIENDEIIIGSNLFDVSIRPRIDGRNAEARLLFTREKVALISSNESIGNLMDILAVEDMMIYIIDVDGWQGKINVFKVNRDNSFFELDKQYRQNIKERASKLFFD